MRTASAQPSGVEFVFRHSDPALWRLASETAGYLPVLYTDDSIDYQTAYHSQDMFAARDLSAVLQYGGATVAIWPLTLLKHQEVSTLTSAGLPILPPLYVPGVGSKVKKRITTSILDWVDLLCNDLSIQQWRSTDVFIDESGVGISEWHHQILDRGGSSDTWYDLYVDLTLGLDEIRKSFRKSYKPLINVGMATWKVDILSTPDGVIWGEFKNLHRRVAGRVTRSEESWALQLAAIAAGKAFLVSLRNAQAEMVGGGYFATSSTEGVYAVAAYDRSLFDQPLGHVVQQVAIEEMKRRGLRWYQIGRRPYAKDSPTPSPKELSIGEFKQGFASHIFPRYLLTVAGNAVLRDAAERFPGAKT